MGTNTANPERLEALATTLDGAADGIETWGQAAANTMYALGYATAGSPPPVPPTAQPPAARSDANAFTDALPFSYTELLTLGHLSTGEASAVAASIDEFFAPAPHLDRDLYDFSDGAGGLLADLTDRQTQAYGEWISFASGSPEINDAISRMLAEFLQALPHHAG